MKQTGSTNKIVKELIFELRKISSKENSPLWKRVACDLSMSSRKRRVVNVATINRVTSKDEVVVVPGKVLGAGELKQKVIIAALSFSDSAREEIQNANGKCLSISELLKSNPKGKNIRLIG